MASERMLTPEILSNIKWKKMCNLGDILEIVGHFENKTDITKNNAFSLQQCTINKDLTKPMKIIDDTFVCTEIKTLKKYEPSKHNDAFTEWIFHDLKVSIVFFFVSMIANLRNVKILFRTIAINQTKDVCNTKQNQKFTWNNGKDKRWQK